MIRLLLGDGSRAVSVFSAMLVSCCTRTTQPFKLHFTDTEQYFFRPPGLLSVTFTDTGQSISGVDPPHHGKLAVIYPQIHDQRLSRVRSAVDVFVLVGSLAEAFVCIHLGTAFLSLLRHARG